MPDWQPNWTNVRFDHARARTAADELRRCATLLDAQTDRRAVLARRAQDEWRGRTREQFDAELARITAAAASLVDALRRLASDIEEASRAAAAEQRERETARARWWDETRLEEATRAERGLPPTPQPMRPVPMRAF